MAVVTSLVRSINIGPKTKVSMEGLRAIYQELGLKNVRTYINSGNVLFESKRSDFDALARDIRNGIEKAFNYRTEVFFRTAEELDEAIAKNPFAGKAGIEPSRFLVMFLNREPAEEAWERVKEMDAGRQELHLCGRECFLYFPDGMARPKLPWATAEKKLAVTGTGRNWNTVLKLAELARAKK